VILVTGDAYVDHPSFGAALIGRVLEEQGFRVGIIIAQPAWHSAEAFSILGKPAVMFGVTAGNMDSLVNHYTAERRIRSDDAYSPGAVAGLRPDRATIVYAQRCREAFPTCLSFSAASRRVSAALPISTTGQTKSGAPFLLRRQGRISWCSQRRAPGGRDRASSGGQGEAPTN